MRTGILACLAAGVCFVLGACGAQIDAETYDQIANGMTLGEVQNLLGSDGEKQVVTGSEISSSGLLGGTSSEDSSRQLYVWKEAGLNKPTIGVTFENGVVVSKMKQNF